MNFLVVIPVIIILISVIIVKIASIALNLTGLDEKRSFFQALSSFTGTGFTTRDSEYVVSHDIRRKIIIILMIVGNAGFVSVITTLILSLKGGFTPTLVNIILILVGILIVIRVSLHKGLVRRFTKKIQSRLMKSRTFTNRPVEEVLRLAEGYGVAEVTLNESCVDVGKTLSASSFRAKDILVLAIERGTSVMPAPVATDRLLLNDVLICYGKLSNIESIGRS